MDFGTDINENDILKLGDDVLEALLRDHTTGRNIFWATSDYETLGEGYGYFSPMLPELVSGDNNKVVRPRVLKDKALQTARSKGMAEVFTPSWVCNAQINLVDEAWFGRKDVFNRESDDSKTWTPTEGRIEFPEGKTWKDYVRATRFELTCGEGPYLVSRYDSTTGEPIEIGSRIGILDRKLRVVSENTKSSGEWLDMAQEALKNTYAFEWQGDNLLLAREALLTSFIEYYEAKFGKRPQHKSILYAAYIISWNVWQMDGLKGVVPCSCRHGETVTERTLFGETQTTCICPGCKEDDMRRHKGVYCHIRDWGNRDPKTGENNRKIRFIDLIKR